MFEMTVALIMISVVVALLIWFRRDLASASYRRMMGMMTRVRLDPGIADDVNPKIQAIMKDVRSRCAKCMHEGYCERWLAGEVEGPNTFCPNASALQRLEGTPG